MRLTDTRKETVLSALRLNGTRPGKVEKIEARIGKRHVRIGMDDKWTVVVAGELVGVAKRATYVPMQDEEKAEIGIAIAASRL